MAEAGTELINSRNLNVCIDSRKGYIVGLKKLGVIDSAMCDVFIASGTASADIHTYACTVARGRNLELQVPPPPKTYKV